MSETLLDKARNLIETKRVIGAALALSLGASACGSTTSHKATKKSEKGTTKAVHYGRHNYAEVAQSEGGVEVFKDYYYVSGRNPQEIEPGETIEVNCVAYGQVFPAPTALGTWYHIVSPKKFAGEYAASNAFYNNGNTDINKPNNNAIDPRLRDDICPGSAPAPLKH